MKNRQYVMSDQELRQVQKVQLEMIREVDRICKKCGIRYTMVGGTMLGAIRHRGYIPWDDDADIGFLREEYEKFRAACETELNQEKFYFQDYRNTPGYRWGYGKLRRKNSLFIRLNQEEAPYEQGIFIDIMPFDYVPQEYLQKRIHKLQCFCYRKIFWSAIGKDTAKRKWERFLYRLLYRIPEKKVYASFGRFISKSDKTTTDKVRILTFPTPKGVYGYEVKWYLELSEYPFEDLRLPGAADYDGYLGVKYGDYRILPEQDKRKTHPVSQLMLPEDQSE